MCPDQRSNPEPWCIWTTWVVSPNPNPTPSLPGLHTFRDVLAGRVPSTPLTYMGIVFWKGPKRLAFERAQLTHTSSLLPQLCAGSHQPDVHGPPGSGDLVSVTQVEYNLSPNEEEERRWPPGRWQQGRWWAQSGALKCRLSREPRPQRVHYSCFLKISPSKHLTPLERICIYSRPLSVHVFPAPAKSLGKPTLFSPANETVLLEAGMSRLCTALVFGKNIHS